MRKTRVTKERSKPLRIFQACVNLLVPEAQNISNPVLFIFFLMPSASGKTISTRQNRHGEGERLYRWGHFQVEIADSIIPSAATALQGADAKLTSAATRDYIQLYEGEAEQLMRNLAVL